jgi:hypothetical protein
MTARSSGAGKLYIWTYQDSTRSYAGWHLNADHVACSRISEVIAGVAAGSLRVPQVFAVSPATTEVLAVPNNRRAKARSARELHLLTDPDPRRFSLEERDGVLALTAGSERLEELRKSIIGITRGEGDFAMKPDGKRPPRDERLWFWW